MEIWLNEVCDILIVSLICCLVLNTMLWISMIFLENSFEKAFLIFRISAMLPWIACANNIAFWKCLDLVRILGLGWGGRIGERTLEILIRDALVALGKRVLFLLNCTATHWQNDLELLSTRSLSHSDSYIAVINSYATMPNSEIWGILLLVLFPRDLCLIKVAILWSEYVMFFASSNRNSSMPNSDINKKLPSQSCGSAGWFVWYGITDSPRSRGVGAQSIGFSRGC